MQFVLDSILLSSFSFILLRYGVISVRVGEWHMHGSEEFMVPFLRTHFGGGLFPRVISTIRGFQCVSLEAFLLLTWLCVV